MGQSIFKQCPMCFTVWKDRESFLRDSSLEVNGYQVDFDNLGAGLIYFTHARPGCYSTMTVAAEEFFDLNTEKRYTIRQTGKKDCPGYCFKKSVLEKCEIRCECAYVRDVIAIVNNYSKK